MEVEKFSKRAIFSANEYCTAYNNAVIIDLDATAEDLFESINDPAGEFEGFNLLNLDIRSITSDDVTVWLLTSAGSSILDGDDLDAGVTALNLVNDTDPQSLTLLDNDNTNTNLFGIDDDNSIGLLFVLDSPASN